MEKAAEKKTKPRYNPWQNAWWMMRRAWGIRIDTEELKFSGRSVVPMAAAEALCAVALATLELFCAPAVLRQVEGGGLSGLLLTVAFFCGGLMLVNALLRYLEANHMFARVFVRINIINDLSRKYCRTSYAHIEQPDFLAAADQAYQNCGSNDGPLEGAWNTLVRVCTHVLNFSISLFLLVRLEPMLLLVTVGAAVLGHAGELAADRWITRRQPEEQRIIHRVYYFEKRTKDVTLAKDIRVFGMHRWLERLYDDAMRLMSDFYRKYQTQLLIADIVRLLLDLVRTGAAYAWLLGAVLAGNIDAAGFLLYFGAVSSIAGGLAGLFTELENLNAHSRHISEVREFLETPEPYRFEDGGDIPTPTDGRYTIELKDVSYRYPGAERDTLSHIDLTVTPGEKLAVVGLNGAGKTTLIKLLCGFLDPTGGAVLLNGVDIRTYDRRQYYALFSAVYQKISVLPASVAENVAQEADAKKIDRARVTDSLDKAGLAPYIATLPRGIDTMLGRDVYLDGGQLSGGQEQRLMLARALYKNAPLLVLDEPTAALDPLAESDVYQKYGQMTQGHTALFISHRLASTRFCDRILLIADGKIAESGTHDELLKSGGSYAELFAVQSKYYQENPDGQREEELLYA